MSLILLHHVPQFILTMSIDLTFSGGVTWAGWLNICSSMVVLVNTLGITKCGEGRINTNRKEDEDLEVGTLTATACDESVAPGTECDESVGPDYKAMPVQ
jgi:hypothetical protein